MLYKALFLKPKLGFKSLRGRFFVKAIRFLWNLVLKTGSSRFFFVKRKIKYLLKQKNLARQIDITKKTYVFYSINKSETVENFMLVLKKKYFFQVFKKSNLCLFLFVTKCFRISLL